MSKVIQKAKDHLRKHKVVYISGGVAFLSGVVLTLVYMHGRQIVINDSFNVSYKSPKENIVTTILERRGHPGNKILCDQTGEVFASQARAAAANDIDPGSLSKYLAGRKKDIKGLTFTNLGEME